MKKWGVNGTLRRRREDGFKHKFSNRIKVFLARADKGPGDAKKGQRWLRNWEVLTTGGGKKT